MSKALAKSKKMQYDECLFARAFVMLENMEEMACSVDLFLWKPNCSSESILFFSMNSMS